MYILNPFEEKDSGKLFDFLEAYSFGLLVSLQRGEPFASHLPFLLERGSGPQGLLGRCYKGHLFHSRGCHRSYEHARSCPDSPPFFAGS